MKKFFKWIKEKWYIPLVAFVTIVASTLLVTRKKSTKVLRKNLDLAKEEADVIEKSYNDCVIGIDKINTETTEKIEALKEEKEQKLKEIEEQKLARASELEKKELQELADLLKKD
jgi:hypothetical protein